jgi:FlaA1/EpsC-like NDP-sugar epimerase
MISDSLIVITALYLGNFSLLEVPAISNTHFFVLAICLLIFHHLFASLYNLYSKAWEYASTDELFAIINSISLSIFTTGIMQIMWHGFNSYLRTLIITWMIYIIFLVGSRLIWIYVFSPHSKAYLPYKRVLIIGAGTAGTMLARHLQKNKDTILKPVAFIDDSQNKQKLQYYGIQVVGTTSDISHVVQKYQIDHIIIAIPSLNKKERERILITCVQTKIKTQVIPKIEDLMSGKVSVTEFKDVDVNDLLGREPVQLNTNQISDQLSGKTVLITGAGGSIGSEICRLIHFFKPKKMILVGHGENSIYSINMELVNKLQSEKVEIVPVVASIQDRNRVFEVIEEYQPHIIYHAAAHKHVPLMEDNKKEAILNNVFGTKNLAEAADTFGTETFVLISTDKAVYPINVMGATKKIAEMLICHLDTKSKTKFVAVRFGNVLGSRGSVVPLFKKQIKEGGPVTVTHPDMTRYFMTIPEASQLVIQAGALAKGGELFVLDMGDPIKVVDLAEKLIQLSGYDVDEIGITFTGKRQGEKLHEKIVCDEEVVKKNLYPKIHLSKVGQADSFHDILEFVEQQDIERIEQEIQSMIIENLDKEVHLES